MPAIEVPMSVLIEGKEVERVTADQRDIAHCESVDFYGNAGPHTKMRYLAWVTSKRQGLTKLDWKAFSEQLIEAVDADDKDTELDPTKTDRFAEN